MFFFSLINSKNQGFPNFQEKGPLKETKKSMVPFNKITQKTTIKNT